MGIGRPPLLSHNSKELDQEVQQLGIRLVQYGMLTSQEVA